MSELHEDDRVLVADQSGNLVYSDVIMFLDNDRQSIRVFYEVLAENGVKVTITPSHLIYVRKDDRMTTTFAANLEVGDFIYVVETSNSNVRTLNNVTDNVPAKNNEDGAKARQSASTGEETSSKRLVARRVVSVTVARSRGVFAPLTREGTVVVDGTLASCYAVIDSHAVAHWAFIPVRAYKTISKFLGSKLYDDDVIGESNTVVTSSTGVHWYPRTLYAVSHYLLPSSWLYGL